MSPYFLGGAMVKLAAAAQTGQHQSSKVSADALAKKVDEQNGLDSQAVAALLQEARRVIIAARGALF